MVSEILIHSNVASSIICDRALTYICINTVLGVFMLLFAKTFHHDSTELVNLRCCLVDQWYSFKRLLGSRSFMNIGYVFLQQVDS